MPKWNPVNICSYHLQEAGATPVQEVGFALATAVAVLDAVRDSGQVPPERMGDVVAADLLLRQRRGALRRGDGQDAGVRRAVGRDHPRALRRDRPEAAPVPLRRTGQLAGPDRGAAGEQRPAHRAGDARRDPLPGRPGPRRPAARLERGARPAPAVGPAVVAAHAAGAGVRVGPAGVPRPVRGLARDDGAGRRDRRRRPGRAGQGPGDGRRGGRRGDRLPQERAGRLAGRAAPPDGVRRRRGGRRQPVHRDRAVAADRRRCRGHRAGRPGGRGGGHGAPYAGGGPGGTTRRSTPRWPGCARTPRPRRT